MASVLTLKHVVESDGYSVHHTNDGVAVKGSLNIDDFGVLAKQWAKSGIATHFFPELSKYFGVSAFLSTPKKAEALKKRIDAQRGPRPACFTDRVAWWRGGWDKGLSSEALLALLLREKRESYPTPHDAEDVGRCLRMLEILPELRLSVEDDETWPVPWRLLWMRWMDIEAAAKRDDWQRINQICDECNR